MKNKFIFTAISVILVAFISITSACGQKSSQINQTKPKADTKINSKLFGVNLIKNGGAEAENVAQWTNAGDDLKTFRYDGGWGDAWQVTPPNHGENFFYTRVSFESPAVEFSQELDVSEIAKQIDAGSVGYNSGAWFGVRGAAAGRLKVEFYDANKTLIKRPEDADATEKITLANRPDDVTMVEKTRAGDVPSGTRKIKITLEFSLFEGVSKENEGESPLADNLSLVLAQKK
ncbi:MAG: hypothetical protein ABWZ66_08955 [Pyrinomonadaceae bacterium]